MMGHRGMGVPGSCMLKKIEICISEQRKQVGNSRTNTQVKNMNKNMYEWAQGYTLTHIHIHGYIYTCSIREGLCIGNMACLIFYYWFIWYLVYNKLISTYSKWVFNIKNTQIIVRKRFLNFPWSIRSHKKYKVLADLSSKTRRVSSSLNMYKFQGLVY